jgi:hypothetical protein
MLLITNIARSRAIAKQTKRMIRFRASLDESVTLNTSNSKITGATAGYVKNEAIWPSVATTAAPTGEEILCSANAVTRKTPIAGICEADHCDCINMKGEKKKAI